MWYEGNQRKKKHVDVNAELEKAKGFLGEREAKVWLAKFLMENIYFLVRMLTGIKLFPFQSMMVKAMMKSDYFLAILSRGGGKSFICAIFLIVYAAINQGIKVGILANSFRQSRLLMQKIIDLYNDPKSGFLRSCITKISLKNDEWVIEIGRSKLIALPLGQGERLRGYRFQVMVLDELLLMPEKILNEVILPFLAVVTNPTERKEMADAETRLIERGDLKEEDRMIWPNNKLIGLSSASYKFEYLYRMMCQYEKMIHTGEDKHAKYSIFHMAYDALPKELYDPALLAKGKAEMSEAQFEREFGSKFADDSSGYFKMSKMQECTHVDGEGDCVEATGDPRSSYLVSVDPSWSESDSSDDFAIQVLKINKATQSMTLVHSYALPGTPLKEHVKYFHFILTNFNVEGIVMDFMGGVQFLAACNESDLFKKDKIEIKTIDVDIEDPTKYWEDIQEVRNQYNLTDKRICILRKPSGAFIRSANEYLQSCIDHKRIWFACGAIDEDFQVETRKRVPVKELKFLRDSTPKEETTTVDFVENLKVNIEMTKTQCALIEVSTTPQGSQTFDLPLNLKRQRNANKARKDSYSALVLGAWMTKTFFDMLAQPEHPKEIGFTPVMF